MTSIRILTALLSLTAGIAHAQQGGGSVSITNVANMVSGGLIAATFGGGGFEGIAEFLRGKILLILAPIGIFLVVRAGLRLINSQDDDKLTKAKSTIAATCVGIMMAAISDRLVMAFYAPGGTWNRGTATSGATILSTEILGILNWLTVFIAILGVLVIIVSGLKTVSTFGGEDTGPIKRTVSGVATGILMITTSGAVKLALGLLPDVAPSLPGGGNPAPAINRAIDIVLTLLGFTSLIAFGVIVYAGIMMVLNWGNEENYTKGKSLIFRSVIGLAVMLLSGAAVVFIGNLVI
jgi:hypothetical protein